MLGLMILNNLFVVSPNSYAEESDSFVKGVQIFNEEGLDLEATHELQIGEKLRLQLNVQMDEKETYEEFIVPESLKLLENQSGEIIVNEEVLGEYNTHGQVIELSSSSRENNEEVSLILDVKVNEEYINENGELLVEFPMTNNQYIFTIGKNETNKEDVADKVEVSVNE